MDIRNVPFIDRATTQTDVYTNLHGLQSIKNEGDKSEALKKVTQQFESMFVNMMMKSMREANAVFEKDSMFDSEESKFYRDMLDQQRAVTLSTGRGIGIAEAMYRQLSRTYGVAESSGKYSEKLPEKLSENSVVNTPVSLDRRTDSVRKDASASLSNTGEHSFSGGINTSESQRTRASLSNSPQDFVEKLIPLAKKAAEKIGVDHLLLVAQSALETGWGKHIVADEKGDNSFNLFNIKKGSDWNKGTAQQNTVEYDRGVVTLEKAEFRMYSGVTESFDDYVDFVLGKDRYKNAVDNAADSEHYIKALKDAGYATDPQYSDKVLSVYHRVKALADEVRITSDIGSGV